MKLKKHSLDTFKPFHFTLKLPGSYSELVLSLFSNLTETSSSNQKVSVVGKVMETLCNNSEKDICLVTQILFEAFLQLHSTCLLKEKLLWSLSVISGKYPSIYYSCVEQVVKLQITCDSNTETLLNTMVLVVEKPKLIFADLSEESPTSNRRFAFHQEFLNILFQASVEQIKYLWSRAKNSDVLSCEINSLFQSLQQIIKYFGIILKTQNKCSEKMSSEIPVDILQFDLLQIASSVITPLDLRSSCGLLFIQLEIASKKNLVTVFQQIYHKEERFESLKDLGQMILLHSLLCCIEVSYLFSPLSTENSSRDEDLSVYLLRKLHSVISSMQCGATAMIVCRILNNLMIRLLECVQDTDGLDRVFHKNLLEKYSLYSTNTKAVLDLIWALWDHFLATVKHIAKETFILLIKVQNQINKERAVTYFTQLGASLTQSLCQKQSFRALICLIPFTEVDFLIKSNPDMVNKLFRMLSDPTYASHSANMLEALFTKHFSEADCEEWNDFWFNAFFNNFSKGMLVYGYENLLEKLLLLSDDRMKVVKLLSSSEELCDLKLCLLIMCTKISMKIARKGTENENASTQTAFSSAHDDNDPLWKDIIPFHILVTSLASGDQALNILAFNLLCESSKTTALYDERELKVIKSFIARNIANQDFSFRRKFISNVKKALSRILKGILLKTKNFSSVTDKFELNEIINIHTNFIRKLFKFISSNICIGANFSRRSASLQIMELLFDLINNEKFCHLKGELFSQSLKDSLMLCLRDSYEENKIIALKLLTTLFCNCPFHRKQTNQALIKSVWSLASSSKSPDSLTASYLLSALLKDSSTELLLEGNFLAPVKENKRLLACSALLCKLEMETSIARERLLVAAMSGPMYGLLLCLRSLLTDIEEQDLVNRDHLWSSLIKKILATCLVIADIVSSVVKNSSPEGHLPTNLSEGNDMLKEATSSSLDVRGSNRTSDKFLDEKSMKYQGVTARMLLLCGWRSIKEISLLFGHLMKGSSSVPNILTLLSLEDVESIGAFFMTQLTETKHRGAFEQAYSGFVMMCNKLWNCTNNKMNKMPEIWLKYTIEAIQDESSSRLCATRRSAGVPFIIQAIISTEPSLKGCANLKATMETLFQLVNSEVGLECRIHVLNILRTLFRDAKIGGEVIPYVSKGVKLAVEGYEDNSWSVRNSSSLMFASLLNRMLGVKKIQEDLHSKNTVSVFVFFKRYPDLHKFFLEKLAANVVQLKQGQLASSSFPLLMMLARLNQTSSDGHSSSIPLMAFVPLIIEFSSSPVYQLRCLVSRALIPFVTPITVVDLVEQLSSSMTLQNQNHLHGTLLCLIQVLESFRKVILASEEMRKKVIVSLYSVVWVASEANPCLFTRACGTNLFTYLVREDLLSFSPFLESLATECFSFLLGPSHDYRYVPGAILANKESIAYFLTVYKRRENKDQEPLLNFLDSPSLEVQTSILKHFLSLDLGVQALNEKIISRMKRKEQHPDCIKLSYNLITRSLINYEQKNYSLHWHKLDEILDTIFVGFNSDVREDLLISMIETSQTIIAHKMKFGDQPKEQIISKWVELLSTFSCTDFSFDVRLGATQALSEMLASLHLYSNVSDKIELNLIRTVIDLLLDDDCRIQTVSSKGTSKFLESQNECNDERNAGHVPPTSWMTLESLISYVASKRSSSYFSLLIYFGLKEVDIEEFHLPQEEDGAFEKRKSRMYREDLLLTKLISRAISARRVTYDARSSAHLHVDLEILTHYLFVIRSNSIPFTANSSDSRTLLRKEEGKPLDFPTGRCSVSDFLNILKKEIELILEQLTPLVEVSPFEIRQCDMWIERLARRALLWSALRKNTPEYVGFLEQTRLSNIVSSLIKPTRFSQILEWLQQG